MRLTLVALVTLLPNPAYSECIDFEGRERCWIEAAPGAASAAADGSLPLLIDLHGLKSSNEQIKRYGLGTLYNDENFVVAWPQGVGEVGKDSSWHAGDHCCGAALEQNVNDEGFLLKVVEIMIAQNPKINNNRVYVSGHSNGCIMSNTMALKHSDVIAAMGCFSGYGRDVDFVDSYRPMNSIIAQGTEDKLIRYHFVERWVDGGLKDVNKCANTPAVVEYGAGNNVETYSCADNVEVALITLEGVGHDPYKDLDDSTSSRQYVWNFISRGALLPDPPSPTPPTRTRRPTSAPPPPPPTSSSSTASGTLLALWPHVAWLLACNIYMHIILV